MAIYPRTYEEVMRFKRCMQAKTIVPEIDEETLEKMYNFVGEDVRNKVSVSGNMLSFTDFANNVVFSMAVTMNLQSITALELTGRTFSVSRPYSYSGGDGGSSGNNNNNNNNNNG